MHTTDLKLLLPAVPGKDNLSHAATSGYYFSGLRHGSIVLGYLVVRFPHTAPRVEYSAISLSADADYFRCEEVWRVQCSFFLKVCFLVSTNS